MVTITTLSAVLEVTFRALGKAILHAGENTLVHLLLLITPADDAAHHD